MTTTQARTPEPVGANNHGAEGWARGLAAVGAVLAAWVAFDSLTNSGLASAAADDLKFFLLWGAPFAVVSVFLGWFALRGGHAEVRSAAKRGCLGGLLLGGGTFVLCLASPLILPRDVLSGAVTAFLYAPVAAALGLVVGVAADTMRRRRR
jgi:hypothetical protein